MKITVDWSVSKLRESGFEGDNIFIGSHSLGGVVAQGVVKNHPGWVKGLILTASYVLEWNQEL